MAEQFYKLKCNNLGKKGTRIMCTRYMNSQKINRLLKWKIIYLEFLMNTDDPIAQSFSSQSSNFNFFQFQKLLSSSEKFFDDVQTIHKTVETTEDQMLLKISLSLIKNKVLCNFLT